jgi:hypothetical protein
MSYCSASAPICRISTNVWQKFLRAALVLALVCYGSEHCVASNQLLVVNTGEQDRQVLHVAADYYGLSLEFATLRSNSDVQGALKQMADPDVIGAVISSEALLRLSPPEVLAALRRGRDAIPLFVNNVTAATTPYGLQRWSLGAIAGCVAPVGEGKLLRAGGDKSLLHELADLSLPLANAPACEFVGGKDPRFETLAEYGTTKSAIFVRVQRGPQEIFFAVDLGRYEIPTPTKSGVSYRTFSQLVPAMVFARHAAGEYGWHSPAHYANLTVDDAWLTEPYGHLNYHALLVEMEKHNFHTTIGFIPWNFDRGDKAAIDLVRTHPTRYSVCIHGDNHDHMEFSQRTWNGQIRPLPDEEQASRLKQAIARMERFRARTGIPYDRFMIFPHEKFPAVTLRFLKKYNYIAMANEGLVPLGRRQPKEATLSKGVSTSFENFPSIWRQSAERPVDEYAIAIEAFLEHPLLFYVHHGYFAPGANAFDATADFINRIDPEVKWSGLGEMARHLYKLRKRSDDNFDVLASTADFQLRNSSTIQQKFYVVKGENFTEPLRRVVVDGIPVPYTRLADKLMLTVEVPAGEERNVRIEYDNDLKLDTVEISKRDLRINTLRRISDFRDLVLSRSRLGDQLVVFYYAKVAEGWTQDLILLLCLFIFLLCLFAGRVLWLAIRGRWQTRRGHNDAAERLRSSITR